MLLVDSHCHLDSLDFATLHHSVDDALVKAKAQDVGFVLAVATTLPGYQAMTQLIGQRNDVAFSCGVHPLNLEGATIMPNCAVWQRQSRWLPWGNRAGLLLSERQYPVTARVVPPTYSYWPGSQQAGDCAYA